MPPMGMGVGPMRSIAALALCPLLYGLPATAANLEAGYSVRWAGIEIARFEVELRTSPADYRLAYRAETTGALAWVFDFASDGSATGRLTPEGPIAGQYRGRSASDDHTSQWRVDFTADGAVSEVVLDEELDARFGFLQNGAGAVPGPFDAYLTMRGLKTLELRMQRHCENAAVLAAFLADHAAVSQVLYPGLPSHPGHDVAARQMRGFGGMISVRMRGGAQAARDLCSRTEVFILAESLGGVESLIEHPGAMTHASTAGSQLEVPDDLVRMSVGIEDTADLLGDLEQALA